MGAMGSSSRARWLSVVAGVAAACGSSEASGPGREQPDAGRVAADAGTLARGVPDASEGAGGRGARGAGGASSPVPTDPEPEPLGTGCALGADPNAATQELPFLPPDTDATTGLDASATPGELDAGRDGSSDSGSTPGGYPPLNVSAIGRAVVVSNQFQFTEGPVWDPRAQALFFTDINADVIYRLRLPATIDVYADRVGYPDGLALEPDGTLVAAGFAARDVARFDGSEFRTLVSEYRERRLNSPDDLEVRSDGTVYFTDPLYGIDGSQGLPRQEQELCFQGVYRLTPEGRLFLEDSSTAGPNGVGLSPDEGTLYVSYTISGEVDAFDIAPDGSLGGKQRFATVLAADSMCLDAAGNLYVASLTGLTVLDRRGRSLGQIRTSQQPTNCAFGGPDQRTLFITARGLFLGAPTPGTASLMRIDDMPIPGIPGRQ